MVWLMFGKKKIELFSSNLLTPRSWILGFLHSTTVILLLWGGKNVIFLSSGYPRSSKIALFLLNFASSTLRADHSAGELNSAPRLIWRRWSSCCEICIEKLFLWKLWDATGSTLISRLWKMKLLLLTGPCIMHASGAIEQFLNIFLEVMSLCLIKMVNGSISTKKAVENWYYTYIFS